MTLQFERVGLHSQKDVGGPHSGKRVFQKWTQHIKEMRYQSRAKRGEERKVPTFERVIFA